MNDLISRSALLTDIEDTVVISARNTISTEMRGVRKTIGRIEAAPAVDAVEVVRCWNCKHYKPQKKSVYWENSALSCNRSVTMKMPPDGFCSCGERKTE